MSVRATSRNTWTRLGRCYVLLAAAQRLAGGDKRVPLCVSSVGPQTLPKTLIKRENVSLTHLVKIVWSRRDWFEVLAPPRESAQSGFQCEQQIRPLPTHCTSFKKQLRFSSVKVLKLLFMDASHSGTCLVSLRTGSRTTLTGGENSLFKRSFLQSVTPSPAVPTTVYKAEGRQFHTHWLLSLLVY